jgi:hypothetical protein
LIINTALLLIGIYLIAKQIFFEDNQAILLWGGVSVLPVALLISYSGMETSLLIFTLGIIISTLLSGEHKFLSLLALFLLPWIRPESVLFGIIIIFVSLRYGKIKPIFPFFALCLGSLTLVLFNLIYFGSPFNQTIVAKSIAYAPSYSIKEIISRLVKIFWSNGYGGIFSPLMTKYLNSFGIVFLIVILMAFYYFWVKEREKPRFGLVVLAFGVAVVIPAAYGLAGAIFPWYFWPSTLFAYVIILGLVLDKIGSLATSYQKIVYSSLFVVLVMLYIGQLLLSLNWGLQERYYRGGIGEYIKSISTASDRLLLEPAGYIPYYSELFTYDAIGLVSPVVTEYRKTYSGRWWIEFVKAYQPEFILERESLTRYITLDGYELSEPEKSWFISNYTQIKEFNYLPSNYIGNPYMQKILSLGSAENYYLYKSNQGR